MTLNALTRPFYILSNNEVDFDWIMIWYFLICNRKIT